MIRDAVAQRRYRAREWPMSTRELCRPDHGSRRLGVAAEPDASVTSTAAVRVSRSAKAGMPSGGHIGSDATSLVGASTIAPPVRVIDHRRRFAAAGLAQPLADTPGGLADPISAHSARCLC
jgi:hypothetical protein